MPSRGIMSSTDVVNVHLANLLVRCDKLEKKVDEMNNQMQELRINVIKIVTVGALLGSILSAVVTPIVVGVAVNKIGHESNHDPR